MKQLGMVLAFMLILMPMMALASDRISEDLNLQKELYMLNRATNLPER
jgi:hypothetical protein